MTSFFRTLSLIVALVPSSAVLAQSAPPPPESGRGDFKKVREACGDDLARFCKDIKPGGGRIRECLRAHEQELSDGCKVAIRDAQAHHHPHPDQD